jgi:hypothetical protein
VPSQQRQGVVVYDPEDTRARPEDLYQWIAEHGYVVQERTTTWIGAVAAATQRRMPIVATSLRHLTPAQIDRGLCDLAAHSLSCITTDDGELTEGAGARYVRTGTLRTPTTTS